MLNSIHRPATLLLLYSFLQLGCIQHKSLISFPEEQFQQQSPEAILNSLEILIQPEDLLYITVHSFDLEAAQPFNLKPLDNQVQQQNNVNTLELFEGYFVDKEGNIDFPVLGKVSVEGLTLEAAKYKLAEQIQPYLKDAVVNMRFLNFRVTVLGEVNRPGMVRTNNRRITLLEALGLAGDLTSYANRTNLLVIREQEGQRSYSRLSLTDPTIFESPYFYLQQNDVIYIEPIQAKTATVADPVTRAISYASGVVALLTLIITVTR